MNISDLRSKPHISVSAVNSYVNCGLQYKFRRIDRLPPESISDNLVFGSAVHKSLADFNQEKMTGSKLALNDLQGIFEYTGGKMLRTTNSSSYSTGKDFKKLLSEGKNLLGCLLPRTSPRRIYDSVHRGAV